MHGGDCDEERQTLGDGMTLATADEEDKIFRLYEELDSYVRARRVCISVASPALMILAANAASHALDDDDHIIEEFARCLKSIRGMNRQRLN